MESRAFNKSTRRLTGYAQKNKAMQKTAYGALNATIDGFRFDAPDFIEDNDEQPFPHELVIEGRVQLMLFLRDLLGDAHFIVNGTRARITFEDGEVQKGEGFPPLPDLNVR